MFVFYNSNIITFLGSKRKKDKNFFLKKQKFKKIYRIQSARLADYNYSDDGTYFITICTAHNKKLFGKIIKGEVELSKIGKIISDEWLQTENIRKNVQLGEFIIMPNHFHGIISIKKTTTSPQNISQHWQSGCLGAIINQFKSICTKKIRKFYPDFQWQTRYYDHIIRDENELFFISEYIINNPKEWGNDKFFP